MKEENIITLVAMGYSVACVSTILFATWVTNNFDMALGYKVAIALVAWGYVFYLHLSFRRCWKIVFNRKHKSDVSLVEDETEVKDE